MKQEIRKPVSPKLIDPDEMLSLATLGASEKKAANVIALDLKEIASFADYLLICSGRSSRQTKAIADEVLRKFKQAGTLPLHVEGYELAKWILIDFGDLIVHVFEESTREFYDLERLWRDARKIILDAHQVRRSLITDGGN